MTIIIVLLLILIFTVAVALYFTLMQKPPKTFSDLLPYRAADFKADIMDELDREYRSNSYYLKDGSALWVYECTPLVLADDSIYDSISNMIRMQFPFNTVIQFLLYADSNVESYLEGYQYLRRNSDPIFKEQAKRFCDFFRQGTKGMWQLSGMPIRNYRLFVSIKVPTKAKSIANWSKEVNQYEDIIKNAFAVLGSIHMSPNVLKPDEFLTYLYSIFNPDLEQTKRHWDISRTLDKQVIYSDTEITIDTDSMKFGNTYLTCVTPKNFKSPITFMDANELTGLLRGAWSNEDDMTQIHSRFMYCLNIVKVDINGKLMAKGQMIDKQKEDEAGNILRAGIVAKKREFQWIYQMFEEGEEFCHIIPAVWIFNEDKEKLNKAVNNLKANWQVLRIDSQRERDYILPKLFVSSLPGGLSEHLNLHRHGTMTTKAAARFIAVNGGYRGVGNPYMLFVDRRGQLVSFDSFYTAANRNKLITGLSGGGKSFLMNSMVSSYLGAKTKMRIFDRGESFFKMCHMFDGTYIHPAKEKIVVNFFDTLKLPHLDRELIKDTDDEKLVDAVEGSLAMLTGIISTMAYSRTAQNASELDKVVIELAIKECYKLKRQNVIIDDIAEFLNSLTDYYFKRDNVDKNNITSIEQESFFVKYRAFIEAGSFISQSLEKYTSKGEYGAYFNGKTNVKLDNELIVIELNNLPSDLERVFTLAFMSILSDEIYSNTTQPIEIDVDEAADLLSGGKDVADFVEGLFRKIRKHLGSICVILQSIADLDPDAGKLKHLSSVLRTQSAYHFMLIDPAFKQMVKKGVIDVSEFEEEFFYSKIPETKQIGYRFSEFLIKPAGGSVTAVRLLVDPYTYLINTSDPNDKNFIDLLTNDYIKQGYTKREALYHALNKCADLIEEKGSIKAFSSYIQPILENKRLAEKTGVKV